MLREKGDYAAAEPLYRQALALHRKLLGDEHPHVATSLNNLAGLFKDKGDYAAGEPLLREALALRRKLLGDEHPEVATSLNNLASLLGDKGDYAAAEPLFREALALRRKLLGDEHPSVATSLNNLAVLLRGKGDYAAAEPMYREALALAERLRTRIIGEEQSRAGYAGELRLSGIAAGYASLLINTDRAAEAWSVAERGRARDLLDLLARSDRDLIEEAQRRARQAGDAKALRTLKAALDKERQAKVVLTTAEALLAGIQKQRQRVERRDDVSEEEKFARLAELDRQLTEQAESIKSKRRALTEAGAQVLIQLHGLFPNAQPLNTEQILVALEPGEIVLAFTWTGQSVQLLVASGSEPTAKEDRVRGFHLAESKNQVAELTTLATQVRSSVADRSAAASGKVLGKLWGKLIPDTIRSQVRAAKRLIVLPDGPLHGIPLEALAVAAPKGVAARLDPGTQIVYAASATMYLNRKGLRDKGTKGSRGAPTALVLGDPIFDREPLPEPDYPQQGVLLAMVAPDSNAANARLSRGDVLLSYAGTKLASSEALGPAIAAVNQAIESGTRNADEPVTVSFWRDGKTKETTLSAGRMGVQPSRGSPADGLRSMARSARGYENQASDISATDQVRLFGGRLSPLPGTRREAVSIANTIRNAGGRVVTLLGEDATIEKLYAAVSGKRLLHLATHGLTGSSERPYDASLALTRPKQITPEDIGFLRLDDLITQWRGRLKDCELVVLSACDTQRGVTKGTGTMALPWGFMYAGAPTVIASLWQVNDVSTSILMEDFYRNLQEKKMTKASALQEAKRTLREMPWEEATRRSGLTAEQIETYAASRGLKPSSAVAPKGELQPPYAHPYYWAPFILIGDPG